MKISSAELTYRVRRMKSRGLRSSCIFYQMITVEFDKAVFSFNFSEPSHAGASIDIILGSVILLPCIVIPKFHFSLSDLRYLQWQNIYFQT